MKKIILLLLLTTFVYGQNQSRLVSLGTANATLTGTPTAPTATAGTNTTQIATTAFVLANASTSGGTVTSVTGTDGITVASGTTTPVIGVSSIAQSKVTGLVSDLALKAPINNPTFTGTVYGITKSMVGLGNIDNTSDMNKPVSTATQTALNLKSNIATTYTKTEVDSRLSNLNQAYHVDFIDSGTHAFTVPSNIIVQNVALNNIPVYGADWSQTGTTVTVTTSITSDKVTLTGGSFVSLDLTNYATNTELATYAKSPLDYQNTNPVDGFIVNNSGLFVDTNNYPTNWVFAPTDNRVPYNGFVSNFRVKLSNAEVGRTVRF